MSKPLDGRICTPEDVALSHSSANPPVYCLTRGESLGLLVKAEAGLVSLSAVLLLFALFTRNVYHAWRSGGRHRMLPIDIYFLSLFVANLTQALGAVMDLKWVNDGKVQQGSYCRAQGITKTIGETAVALSTLVIALHTFIAICRPRRYTSLIIPVITVGSLWLFVTLFSSISSTVHNNPSSMFYVPTPYWCWIGIDYKLSQLFGEYLWLWVALFVSYLLYIPLYFLSRGNITLSDSDTWWKIRVRFHRKGDTPRRRLSYSFMAYPIVYCILVLPQSIERWLQFQQERTSGQRSHIPAAATFSVAAIYTLNGVADVLLFFLTRQGLLLFKPRHLSIDKTPSHIPEVDTIPQPGDSLMIEVTPDPLRLPTLRLLTPPLPSLPPTTTNFTSTSNVSTPRSSFHQPSTRVLFDIVNRHVSFVERNAMTFHSLISTAKYIYEALNTFLEEIEKKSEENRDQYEQCRAGIDLVEKLLRRIAFLAVEESTVWLPNNRSITEFIALFKDWRDYRQELRGIRIQLLSMDAIQLPGFQFIPDENQTSTEKHDDLSLLSTLCNSIATHKVTTNDFKQQYLIEQTRKSAGLIPSLISQHLDDNSMVLGIQAVMLVYWLMTFSSSPGATTDLQEQLKSAGVWEEAHQLLVNFISHFGNSLVPVEAAIQDKVNDFEANLKLCTRVVSERTNQPTAFGNTPVL